MTVRTVQQCAADIRSESPLAFELDDLFDRAMDVRSFKLDAMHHERIADYIAERLATVKTGLANLIEALARQQAKADEEEHARQAEYDDAYDKANGPFLSLMRPEEVA